MKPAAAHRGRPRDCGEMLMTWRRSHARFSANVAPTCAIYATARWTVSISDFRKVTAAADIRRRPLRSTSRRSIPDPIPAIPRVPFSPMGSLPWQATTETPPSLIRRLSSPRLRSPHPRRPIRNPRGRTAGRLKIRAAGGRALTQEAIAPALRSATRGCWGGVGGSKAVVGSGGSGAGSGCRYTSGRRSANNRRGS